MSLSPPVIRARKRDRQLHFDLNRSTPNVLRRIRRPSTPRRVAEKEIEKMSQEEESFIRDLSKTIMSGTSNMPRGANPVHNMNKPVEEENLEKSIRLIVDQSVGSQMTDMKKIIADLTSTVSKLSLVVHQTQLEHKRLVENNLPSTSKPANGSQNRMGTSQMTMESNRSSRDSSTSRSYHSRYDNRPSVDKWGLEFDGDQNKLAVEDFVFRVERLQSQYGVSWREVLDNFHLLVKGSAEKWYWLFIQTNYVTEWNTLKQALLKQYQSARSSFELMRDMVERRQLPGESIDSYFFAMIQLRSRLTISMPEAEFIKMIKKNLREGVGRIVYPMSVASVEELKMCCLDAEKTFLRREIRHQTAPINRFNRQVNELYQEPMENLYDGEINTEEVAEARVNAEMGRPLVCWNCRQKGHMFMDCPAMKGQHFAIGAEKRIRCPQIAPIVKVKIFERTRGERGTIVHQ